MQIMQDLNSLIFFLFIDNVLLACINQGFFKSEPMNVLLE